MIKKAILALMFTLMLLMIVNILVLLVYKMVTDYNTGIVCDGYIQLMCSTGGCEEVCSDL